MKLIGADQISISELEKFVSSFEQISLFQHPSFRKVIDKTRDYKWHWVGIEHNGDLVGSLASYDIVDKAIANLVSARRRTIMGGPLISSMDERARNECAAMLLDAIRAIGKKPYFIEFRNLFDMSTHDVTFKSKGYQFEKQLNFLIDVTKHEEEIMKQMSSSGRRMVKKSLKEGLIADEAKNIAEVDCFFDILAAAYSEKSLPLADRSLFQACFTELGSNQCKYIIAKNEEGKVVAGRLELITGMTMYDWYATSDPAYLDRRPNELLVWNALRIAKKMNLRIFDFGGAGRPNEEYGVREFKEKFGGLLVEFGRYLLTTKPIRTAIAKKGMNIILRARKVDPS